MEKGLKSQNFNHKKKFRSPLGGKRPHKASILPKFAVNLKEPEKAGVKTKHGTRKMGSKLQFQMGGDSTDPLNLNSIIDRDPADVTPQCSPPVKELSPQVVIARDVTDPLNLKSNVYQDLKGIVVMAPAKKKRKRKRNDSCCFDNEQENKSKAETDQIREDILSPKIKKKKQQKQQETKEVKIKEKNKNLKDKAISENESDNKSETKAEKKSPGQKKVLEDLSEKTEIVADNEILSSKEDSVKEKETPSLIKELKKAITEPKTNQKSQHFGKQKHKKTFLYGNYNRYYGYRNPKVPDDPRLKLFRPEWFQDKTVLDIGCNIGNVTLKVAHGFSPKHILGIDIDCSLIRTANKSLRCAIQEHVSKKPVVPSEFPMSFMVCRGPIVSRTSPAEGTSGFPYNVQFKEENFVPQSDKVVAKQKATYDVILCLSLTKWIHLNWGDEGLKRTFQRMFVMLNPGGRLLLEAQPLNSYSRRKNLSEKIRKNYDSIKFKPNQFVDYLMSEEVGFASFEALGVSENTSKGFQRPVYVFTKGLSDKVMMHWA